MSKEDTPNDEELRKLLKPKVSLDQAKEVLKRYSKDDQKVMVYRELDSYDDVNFMVSIDDTKYLLKIHNGVESRDFRNNPDSVIHFQTTMFKALNTKHTTAPESITPLLSEHDIPVVVHDLPVISEEHSPCLLVVRLLTWVPGRPMSDVPFLAVESIVDAGQYLAKVHKALDDGFTQHPAANRYHQWDGKNTKDLRAFIHNIDNPYKRKMIKSIIAAFERQIIDTKVFEKFRTGINHGDFNDANLLVDEDGRVSGVIDFGDSIASWRILDVTVAMAYAMLTTYGKSGRMLSAASAFLRGYCTLNTLTKEEREHIVLLTAVRLACSVTLGAYTYKLNPENEYLLLHSKPAWGALELLWGYDNAGREAKHEAYKKLFDTAIDNASTEGSTVSVRDLVLPDPETVDLLASIRTPDASPSKRQKK